jgi:hypothetical protein
MQVRKCSNSSYSYVYEWSEYEVYKDYFIFINVDELIGVKLIGCLKY